MKREEAEKEKSFMEIVGSSENCRIRSECEDTSPRRTLLQHQSPGDVTSDKGSYYSSHDVSTSTEVHLRFSEDSPSISPGLAGVIESNSPSFSAQNRRRRREEDRLVSSGKDGEEQILIRSGSRKITVV